MNLSFVPIYLIADGENSAAIAQNVNGQYALLFAAIAFVVTLAMIVEYYRRRHSKRIVIAAGLLMLTHPIWTVSAISGDLGYGQRNLAFAWTTALVVLLFIMYFRQPSRYNSKKSALRVPSPDANAG
ncbi:hypothetical protein [Mariniblastus fucicola]|uniref:Uncharacterized protein n=1 Tax=Mariniblastus fucicola TaxID=980251 RepID=A0A5B9P7C8_9BACT|nr:hypothetical protein [Mariniblastus fucicola]QEG22218.1 hypothetical protein MFFC18_20940 [Mariniblastus fucicola]